MLVFNNFTYNTLVISGIILKRALQGAGLKQDEAAKKLGISRPTLSVWCNKDSLSQDIIQNVKTKLGIDLLKALIADENMSVVDGTDQVRELTERLRRTIEEAKGSMYDTKESFQPEDSFDLIESLKQTIRSKDDIIEILKEVIQDLKARLAMYEEKPKTGTN